MNSTSYSQKAAQQSGTNFRSNQQRPDSRVEEILYQGAASQSQLGANPASLKSKLQGLEEIVKAVSDELSMHKKELQILKSEKDSLENVLTKKTQDVKTTLTNELMRLEDEMKRHFQHQNAENTRLQQQINTLKQEKTALQQTLLGLQRRISELEAQIGNAESNQ